MTEVLQNTVRLLDSVVQIPAFGNGHKGAHIYDDTVAAASRGGYTLHSDIFDWECLYPGQPWASWSKVRLSGNRCNYVFPNGDVLLKSTIRRVAGLTEPREHEWLVKMFSLPNSQVKNFLNACRGTFGNQKDSMSILVIGSKAREGTGLWTKLFALYTLSLSKDVVIDFIDPAERASYWEYEIDGKKVSCSWLVGLATPEMSAEYDVVIDDSWVGGVSSIGYDISRGSIKGKGELFLHPKEKREFKSEISKYQAPCKCVVCQEIGKCVTSYNQYQVMRMFCTRLGHNAPCASAFYTQELTIVSRFVKTLLTTGTVELSTNSMIRGLLAVMEDIPVDLDTGVVRLGEGLAAFRDVSRFKVKTIKTRVSSAPHLDNKKVLFVGVPATVLEGVILKKTGDAAMHGEKGVDAIFVQSRRLWAQVTATPYCPMSIYVPMDTELSIFPGWKKGKYKVSGYQEYVREIPGIEVSWEIGQYCNGKRYDPIPFSPVLDVSAFGKPLIPGEMVGGQTFWRIEGLSLKKIDDPTFMDDHSRMLAVDNFGHYRPIYAGSSGRLSFGENTYAFLHPREKLSGNDLELINLILRSQDASISEKEMKSVQKGVGDILSVTAKEITEKVIRKGAKGQKQTVVVKKYKLRYLYSQHVPPFFLISSLTQLMSAPILGVVDTVDLDVLESEWAKKVALDSVTFVERNVVRDNNEIYGSQKGVRMKD